MELIEFSLNRIFDINRYRIPLTDRPLHLSLHLTQPLFGLSRYVSYNVKGRGLRTLLAGGAPPPPPPPPRRKGKAGRRLSALCNTLNLKTISLV